MRNRITWDSVEAPSFRDALSGTQLGANLLSGGFNQLGQVAQDIRGRQKETASSDAMAKAMQFTDPAKWEQMMASGGISSLGINPKDMTAEAMEYFSGRNADLLDNTQQKADTVFRTTQTGLNINADARAQETMGFDNAYRQAQIDESRTKTGLAVNQDNRLQRSSDLAYEADLLSLDNSAAAQEQKIMITGMVDEAANGSNSLDEAKRKIVSQGLPDDVEKAALGQLGSVDPIQWSASEEAISATQALPVYNDSLDALDGHEIRQNLATGGDKLLRFYGEANKSFEGSNNPIMDVVDEFKSPNAEENEVKNWSGTVVRDFNELVDETGLPPEMIALAIRNNFRNTNIVGVNSGNIKVDKKAVRQLLGGMSDDQSVARLEKHRVSIAKQNREMAVFRKSMSTAADNFAKASTKGDEEAMARAMKKMQSIEADVADFTGGDVVSSAKPDPKPKMTMEEFLGQGNNVRQTTSPGSSAVNPADDIQRYLENAGR